MNTAPRCSSEDEQREFRDFLARLHQAKDKAEFDATGRRSRPSRPEAAARRACQGWPRLRGPPKGLALIGPSTVASLIGSGLEAVKFTPLVTLLCQRCINGPPEP